MVPRLLAACALALPGLAAHADGARGESDCWRIASAVWARPVVGDAACVAYGSAGLSAGPNARVLVMVVDEGDLQDAADRLHARLRVPLILLASGAPRLVSAALDVLKDRHGIEQMLVRD